MAGIWRGQILTTVFISLLPSRRRQCRIRKSRLPRWKNLEVAWAIKATPTTRQLQQTYLELLGLISMSIVWLCTWRQVKISSSKQQNQNFEYPPHHMSWGRCHTSRPLIVIGHHDMIVDRLPDLVTYLRLWIICASLPPAFCLTTPHHSHSSGLTDIFVYLYVIVTIWRLAGCHHFRKSEESCLAWKKCERNQQFSTFMIFNGWLTMALEYFFIFWNFRTLFNRMFPVIFLWIWPQQTQTESETASGKFVGNEGWLHFSIKRYHDEHSRAYCPQYQSCDKTALFAMISMTKVSVFDHVAIWWWRIQGRICFDR